MGTGYGRLDGDRSAETVNPAARHVDEFVVGRLYARAFGEPERELFPCFDAVFIGLLRELGDGQMTFMVDD